MKVERRKFFLEIYRRNNIILPSSLPAKVKTMGNVIEITICEKNNHVIYVQMIDKDHYMDLRTGEILDCSHIENRGEGTESIRRTLKLIRDYINANVYIPDNCLWDTFTYRLQDGKPMTDKERLYSDYHSFWKRFKRYCEKMGYDIPEYICVVEPQGSGAWHIHVFFIWLHKAPFIPNDKDTVRKMGLAKDTVTMSELWGQGFTKTKKLNNVDNVGAYFGCYLADMPLDDVLKMSAKNQSLSMHGLGDVTVIQDKEVDGESKRFIKGGRLFLYPPKFNIIRTSRGIQKPVVEIMSQDNAQKKVSGGCETFSCGYEILDELGNSVNKIVKSYYNTKRKKEQ